MGWMVAEKCLIVSGAEDLKILCLITLPQNVLVRSDGFQWGIAEAVKRAELLIIW